MKDIRVMTYNIQSWNITEERMEGLIKKIKEYSPDLIGLQEVTYGWDILIKKEFNDEYYIIGESRFSSRPIDNSSQEKNSILIKKSRFDVIESNTCWLSETPNIESKPEDCMFPRLYTYAVLYEKTGRTHFIFVNTHLDHMKDEGREKEAKCLMKFIKPRSNIPLVMTGDFNSEAKDRSYKIFSDGLIDSKTLFNPVDNSWTWHSYETPSQEMIIDYVFINDFIKPIKYKVDTDLYKENDISDHRPVILDFNII